MARLRPLPQLTPRTTIVRNRAEALKALRTAELRYDVHGVVLIRLARVERTHSSNRASDSDGGRVYFKSIPQLIKRPQVHTGRNRYD